MSVAARNTPLHDGARDHLVVPGGFQSRQGGVDIGREHPDQQGGQPGRGGRPLFRSRPTIISMAVTAASAISGSQPMETGFSFHCNGFTPVVPYWN